MSPNRHSNHEADEADDSRSTLCSSTHADGVQVLPKSQFRLLTGREELSMSTIGRQSCWYSKEATIRVTASCAGGTSYQERPWRIP